MTDEAEKPTTDCMMTESLAVKRIQREPKKVPKSPQDKGNKEEEPAVKSPEDKNDKDSGPEGSDPADTDDKNSAQMVSQRTCSKIPRGHRR